MTQEPSREQLDRYDAGLLNDFGGGNVGWWQDYIRAELERAHDHYQEQLAARDAETIRPWREALESLVYQFTRDGQNPRHVKMATVYAEEIEACRALLSSHPVPNKGESA